MLKQKKYLRALVVGAGSGRDFASAVLLTEKLRRNGAKVDLAGFLPPWALHEFNSKLEQPINKLTKHSRKFSPHSPRKTISRFFEPLLLSLNSEMDLGIKNFYLFSLQHGLENLRNSLQSLVTSKNYDLIVAMDVGGDILARSTDLASIKTPIVDQSALNIFQHLKTKALLLLAVISPGVDGEIPRRRMVEILGKLKQNGSFFFEELIVDDKSFSKYVDVNQAINARSCCYSHTFQMINKITQGCFNTRLVEDYIHEVKVGQTSWSFKFPVELDPDLIRRAYYFDLRKFKSVEFDYRTLLHAFFQLKWSGVGGTEVDFSHIPLEISSDGYHESLYMLTPPSSINGETRKEILLEGLDLVLSKKIGKALIHDDDFALIGIYPGLVFYSVDGYNIIGK